MKKFKEIDAWISSILIIVFLVATLIKGDYTFIIGYLFIGGWQVISMLAHAYCHSFTEKGSIRRNYHWITFISLITMPIGSFWILLFIAPFMAVFYAWLCYDEVRKMNQRPIDILK